MMTIWVVLLCIGILGPASMKASVFAWLVTTTVRLVTGIWLGLVGPVMTTVFAIVSALPALMLVLRPLRRALIACLVLVMFRKVMLETSQTECDIIEAGMIWWNAKLSSGQSN